MDRLFQGDVVVHRNDTNIYMLFCNSFGKMTGIDVVGNNEKLLSFMMRQTFIYIIDMTKCFGSLGRWTIKRQNFNAVMLFDRVGDIGSLLVCIGFFAREDQYMCEELFGSTYLIKCTLSQNTFLSKYMPKGVLVHK